MRRYSTPMPSRRVRLWLWLRYGVTVDRDAANGALVWSTARLTTPADALAIKRWVMGR